MATVELARSFTRSAKALELDGRILSMIGVLLVIWLFFDVATGGLFLSSRNLWNLSVQTSVVALIATGMVFVIVSRNIDLSVGSLLAFLGILGAYLQTEVLPLEGTNTWWLAILLMVAAGAVLGGFQGWVIARFSIPSFVVTLGGLMFWRGAGWLFTSGRTITPLDTTFNIFGGGSIGETYSWIVGIIGFMVPVLITAWKRGRRQKLGFKTKPLSLELLLVLAWGCAIALFVHVMNAYKFPSSQEGRGIPVPVLTVIVIACVMIYVASMTKLGRYIYGYGGNPEAARLSGINTRKVVIVTFAIIGALTGIGAVISTARLNAAPLSIGNLLELQIIAAVVIGGTSLAGGTGTIVGALIGAVLMQSLLNGMVLLGVDSSPQQMIMAGVLIVSVWFDVTFQQRRR